MTIAQNNQPACRRGRRKNAAGKLEELAKNKLELKRPVFFIHGWTTKPDRK